MQRNNRGPSIIKWNVFFTEELYSLVQAEFPVQKGAIGIFGHSMGGHGALTLALKHPDLFKSVSAFAPICAPSQCPWGEKAFSQYLGSDRQQWLRMMLQL
jgi:Predicted esterase